MSDRDISGREEEAQHIPKVDYTTKMAQLQEKLASKKQRFYTLSEEIFDINQECMSKTDDLKVLKEIYVKHNRMYVKALTELSIKEADLQYKREHASQKTSIVTDFALESNKDVERLRSELKYSLQRYQDSRRHAKKLQMEFSKLSDSSRVESLNFLAFVKYSQSIQLNEINKLTVSEELPSKKEVNLCTTEFTKVAAHSRSELAAYYKSKIHEFQREERVQMGKCKTTFENSHRNKDGNLNYTEAVENTLSTSIEHHVHVNSLENRYAQRLLADAEHQQKLAFQQQDSNNTSIASLHAYSNTNSNHQSESAAPVAAAIATAAHNLEQMLLNNSARIPTLSSTPHIHPTPSKSAKKNLFSASAPLTTSAPTAGTATVNANHGYLNPTQNTSNSAVPKYSTVKESEKAALSAPSAHRTAVNSSRKAHFRAQLSALYRSKKKAASALQEMHTAKQKGEHYVVFSAQLFLSVVFKNGVKSSCALLCTNLSF